MALWPDNDRALALFTRMSTQWRVGPGGVIGLDYAAVPVVLRMMAVPRADWPALFDDMRTLEIETLRLSTSKKGT